MTPEARTRPSSASRVTSSRRRTSGPSRTPPTRPSAARWRCRAPSRSKPARSSGRSSRSATRLPLGGSPPCSWHRWPGSGLRRRAGRGHRHHLPVRRQLPAAGRLGPRPARGERGRGPRARHLRASIDTASDGALDAIDRAAAAAAMPARRWSLLVGSAATRPSTASWRASPGPARPWPGSWRSTRPATRPRRRWRSASVPRCGRPAWTPRSWAARGPTSTSSSRVASRRPRGRRLVPDQPAGPRLRRGQHGGDHRGPWRGRAHGCRPGRRQAGRGGTGQPAAALQSRPRRTGAPPPPGGLPWRYDPRQVGDFAAAWTLGAWPPSPRPASQPSPCTKRPAGAASWRPATRTCRRCPPRQARSCPLAAWSRPWRTSPGGAAGRGERTAHPRRGRRTVRRHAGARRQPWDGPPTGHRSRRGGSARRFEVAMLSADGVGGASWVATEGAGDMLELPPAGVASLLIRAG